MAKSSFSPQYKRVADVVRSRIFQGFYSLKSFPSERALASELGVNYMTIRRGIHLLEKENMVVRQRNGRMRVKRVQQGSKAHLNFAFLCPTFSSGTVETWRLAIAKAAAGRPCSIRPILFVQWDDPILLDALYGFDGIFLNGLPETPPETIAANLRHPEHPVVVVDEDFSMYGAPSIQLFPPVFVQKLLDHLSSLGHKCIGCLNTQSSNREVEDRINQWRYWMVSHGLSGQLVNHPIPLHEDPTEAAYRAMLHVLDKSHRPETAWVCITAPAALGATRAMLDRGIQPGRDAAICAVNGEYFASMLNPPLTSLEPADPAPFLSICLDWMMQGGGPWQGPLLMRPHDVPLVIRESTQAGAGRGKLP